MLDGGSDLFCTLRHCKERDLARVRGYSDNHLIKKTRRSLNNVQMPQSNGIKTAGINCDHTANIGEGQSVLYQEF